MSVIVAKNEPEFQEIMVGTDMVDTIRHEMSIQETELLSDERRAALKARLREYYEKQDIVVSDEILDLAVDNMDKNRYVHQPLAPGKARFMARIWINRRKITIRLASALVAVGFLYGSTSFIHNEFVVKPRERAELAAIAEKERLAAEMKLDLETRLPAALKSAHTAAVAASVEYKDDVAKAHADNLRDEAEKFIKAERVTEARSNIDALNEMASSMKAKAVIAGLIENFETEKKRVEAISMDSGARRSIAPLLDRVEAAARKGDRTALSQASKALSDQLYRITTSLQLRIVDRAGVLSGVWRSQDGGRSKVHYLIVEALDPQGAAVAMNIKNFETGKTETVTHWGIRVPEKEYNRVGKDKKDNGVIDDYEVGEKPSGTLDFQWSLPKVGSQMITRW